MGFFYNLRKNMPGSPKSVAQHLLKYYLSDVTKYPHLKPKDLFKKILQDRYTVFKTMSADDINKVVAQSETLLELTLAVIAFENPAAMSSHFQRETFQDIFNFFQKNAPLEFEKFARKAQTAEHKENIEVNHETKGMPDHYTLESRIAALIDACTPEMFNAPHACIVMYKDYRFAYANVQEKQEIPLKKEALAKVYLKEVEAEFKVLSITKKQGLNPKDPEVYMMTDMFAIKCLKILLKRLDETLEEQVKEVREFMGNMPLGEDCDQLSNASAEFGHEHTNPIPVNGLRGEIKYLNRLRCNCDVGLLFHRLGSIVVDGIEGPVNIFETVCLNGKDWDILFFHFYHPRRSILIPKGYSFSDFHPVFSKIPFAFGTNHYDDIFPFGLSQFIIMQFGEDKDQGKAFALKYESFVNDRTKFNRPTTQCDKLAANRRLIEEQKKKVGIEENDIKEKPRQKDDEPGQGKLGGITYKRGDFIGEKYEVHDFLGMGGFGIVYLVYCHETKYVYALKTLRNEYLGDTQTRDRFRKEAQVWIDLERHPYLVRAYFVDEFSGRLYIAMEYIAPDERGLNSLEAYLSRRPPDLAQSLRWAIQFCHGMEYAYSRGMRAHRDIKPANILIGQDKTVKISDFGLAGIGATSERISGVKLGARKNEVGVYQTVEGIALGTPPYMAPEQFLNATACDESSDIYSFGIVLYQMATGGNLPFLPDLSRQIPQLEVFQSWYLLHSQAPVPKLKSALYPVIQGCLSKEKKKRYSSFVELRKDLEPLLKSIAGEIINPSEFKELEAWEWSNKGASYVKLNRHEEAIPYFDKALELDPINAKAWSNKADCLKSLGSFQESIFCANNTIIYDPINPIPWEIKGFCLESLDRSDEAISCYDKAIELDPYSAGAWNGKGITLDRLGRFKEAIHCYDKALELDPEEAHFWNNKGASLHDIGHYEEADNCLDKSLKLDPANAAAWNNKGTSLTALGCFEEAVRCYDRALKLDSKKPAFWTNKGAALFHLNRFKEANCCYDKALELDSTYSLARIRKDLTLRSMDLLQQTIISNSRQSSGLSPQDAPSWHNKGLELYKGADFEKAIYCFEKVLALEPKDAIAWYNKGLSLHGLSRFEEAIHCFDKVFELNPQHANAWSAKGLSLYKKGSFEEAIRCFEKVLGLNPKDAIAWYNKGLSLHGLSRFEEAIISFNKAIEINARNDNTWCGKGLSHDGLNQLDEALHCFEMTLEINPNYVMAWYTKALVQEKQKKSQDAARSYEQFISQASILGFEKNYAKQIEYAAKRLKELEGKLN